MESAQEGKGRSSQNKLNKFLDRAWVKPGLLVFATSVLLFLILKGFFFEIFKVNQADMEDAFFRNELLLLQKKPLLYKRFEVYQIQYPHKDEKQQENRFIQRLIALPGDCLRISAKVVWVNGTADSILDTEKHNYFIRTKNLEPGEDFLLKYGLYQGGKVSTGFDYSYSLRKSNKLLIEKDSVISEIREKSEKAGMFDPECFPGSPHFAWNADHFGSLYIPKAGDTIRLDSNNLPLFETIITVYEGNEINQSGDSIFINGTYCKQYLIQKNYYFFMGDNRDNAVDSRHYGYLPESCIRARVLKRFNSEKP